ncbi:uncharacterized protein LOC122869825 isoform X1 [Siniperca chuatsi]|uniref:uncharacterized protein LOC122869825 isoform X1 n=1 Tax=Siniperca chuatsi TaxID=119488 RepID=UPI001CE2301F|nr:uncharacterized protein LOC122869825 isoform X1 [Siniperca chuatsi]XP_044039095.1 uncharacterized protein LOC122869825 isoform X1 [Siniperca chuatsi]
MMNFTLITALILCSLSWISVSASESQTVNVQPGAEATLLCSKTSESESLALWFRVVNRTKASSISTMTRSASKPLYLDGFKNGIFEMGSNTSTVSLKIKRVNFSDSGLYFCGFNAEGWTILSVIHLNVEGSDESHEDVDRKSKTECDRITMLMSVILGGLTVFLLMVIVGLVVKNRKLQTAASEEQKPQQRENLGTDELNYAAVNFCPKGRRREVEPNVVYSATR